MTVCPNCGEDNAALAKFCFECGARLHVRLAASHGARKTVTVLFCDLVGSTAQAEQLDPESLREVMDLYFSAMRAILERHGGIVEKYIGDAIMAVFGLPRAHEDDALRAVKAASEMSASLESLNLELESQWGVQLAHRTGITTGEVVVGDPEFGQRLATGDAVNVAARLEQAAASNTILIGPPTYRLVEDAVSVEAVEPLALRGKAERVAAFVLIEVKRGAEIIARNLDARLIGRVEELHHLLGVLDKISEERDSRLITVVGEPGVGKSRLVREFTKTIGDRATVLSGRCLSYGEGITFWPLAEVVRNAAGIDEKDSRQLALDKLGNLTRNDVVERVASVLGLSETSFAIEEIFWASRVFLEGLARDRPVVVVFEDIHWAEAAFLDMTENIVELGLAPILIVCAARPELLEGRPAWSEGGAKTSIVDLHPLPAKQSDALIGDLLGSSGIAPEVAVRITAATQGNPLFVEQVISMWLDEGTLYRVDGSWSVKTEPSTSIPPTISALLAARLDRLTKTERAVIAAASAMGQVFYPTALGVLCPDLRTAQVSSALDTLQSKQFVRSDPTSSSSQHVLAFRHVLIRDAAYGAMLKRTRADVHETFATWLEGEATDRLVELQEIIGHHLEQAYRYRVELAGPTSKDESELAYRAAAHLTAAAQRGFGLGDMKSTVNLTERAASLLPPSSVQRAQLLVDLAIALSETGELARANEVLEEVNVIASGLKSASVGARARLAQLLLNLSSRSADITVEETRRQAEATLPIFERAEDDVGLARAWLLIGECYWDLGRARRSEQAMLRVVKHARAARESWEESQALFWLSGAGPLGPTPVAEALEDCRRNLERTRSYRHAHVMALTVLATLEAMRGRFVESRRNLAEAGTILEELGMRFGRAVQCIHIADVEMLADNPAAAERELRAGCAFLEQMGEKGFFSTAAAQLGEVLYEQGRYEEAEKFTNLSQQTAASDDIWSQVRWRGARARILAQRGAGDEAVHLANEAVALAAGTDWLNMQAKLLNDRGDVLWIIGRRPEAMRSLENALRLFEQKGNIVSSSKVRTRLDKLRGEA